MTTTQVIVLIIVLALVALAVAGWFVMRRRSLQKRFGPEYDRLVAERDSRAEAEREMRERQRRHADLELRALSGEARERYANQWQEIQARFLDQPNEAVRDGQALVTELIAERGYPTNDDAEQEATLSVQHSQTLQHYRDAREISRLNDRGEATTEQLRQALVHYRELFAELLGQSPVPSTTPKDGE